MTNFDGVSGRAPAFGRRGAPTAASAAAARATAGVRPDFSGAAAVVASGKLPPWTRHGAGALLAWSLLVLVVTGFMTATYGGELLRDLRLAGTWSPALDLRARDAHCTTYQLMVTLCDATIVALDEANPRSYKTQFMMAFSTGSGEFMVPMRSSADPTAMATGYGAQKKLFNRTLTFGFAFVTFLGLTISGLRKLSAGRYKGGAAHVALMAGIVAVAGPLDAA